MGELMNIICTECDFQLNSYSSAFYFNKDLTECKDIIGPTEWIT